MQNTYRGNLPPPRRKGKLPSARKENSIYLYPHCPKCWYSNRPGELQHVYYDSYHDWYGCDRGHIFKANGKLVKE